jgi:hypothetical protein
VPGLGIVAGGVTYPYPDVGGSGMVVVEGGIAVSFVAEVSFARGTTVSFTGVLSLEAAGALVSLEVSLVALLDAAGIVRSIVEKPLF